MIFINSLLFYGIKYYLQVYLDICAYRIEDWFFDFSKLVLYDRIDLTEGTNVRKTNASKECNIVSIGIF